MTEFRRTNNLEGFLKSISKSSDSMFGVAEMIEERLGLLPFEEVISKLSQDLEIESPEKTQQTNWLNNLYNEQFKDTDSSIIAVTYDERKMVLCLFIMVDKIKYYMVPVRQVSFFINRERAMSELEEFIKNFNPKYEI